MRSIRRFFILSGLILLVGASLPGGAFAQQHGGYNEIFNADGSPRPQYKEIWKIYSSLSKTRKKKFLSGSMTDFQGDNELLPIPRVLTESEYQELARGVAQRGRALHAFLTDYYSGKKSFLKANLIPESVLESIFGRNLEGAVSDFLTRQKIEFWYGPDLIRDSSGRFRVVEDNTGFVGGMGDLIAARNILLGRIPEYESVVAPQGHDPEQFYKNLIDRYKRQAARFGGEPLLVVYNDGMAADKEDSRVSETFGKYGVRTLKLDTYDESKPRKRFQVRDDGLYVDGRKIGLVIVDAESVDVDPKHPMVRDRFVDSFDGRNDWSDYYLARKRLGIDGFWKLYLDGKVGCVNGPGTESINDKQFYMYIEKLIRFYLHEEPILKNIETRSLAIYPVAGRARLNRRLLEKVMSHPELYVFKGVNGRGGNQVWIGPKMKPEEIATLRKEIETDPTHYIVQKYTDLSELDGHIVDLRLLSDVSSDQVIVAPVPWGRATPTGGNGKVNISSNGKETTVLVIDPAKDCNEILHPIQ